MSSIAATSQPLVAGSAAAELLRRLAFDDTFRARLAESPRDALAELGIDVPSSPLRVRLPSKHDAAAALDDSRARGAIDGDPSVFHFFFC